MTKFELATLPPMSPRKLIANALAAGGTRAAAKQAYSDLQRQRVFLNDLYQVNVIDGADGSMHLSIKRRDKSAAHDWRHFQEIKNQIAGCEREAIEIYPPESQLVDGANQYHLWVLPAGTTTPFTWHGGRHVDYSGKWPGVVQRAASE